MAFRQLPQSVRSVRKQSKTKKKAKIKNENGNTTKKQKIDQKAHYNLEKSLLHRPDCRLQMLPVPYTVRSTSVGLTRICRALDRQKAALVLLPDIMYA